MRFTNFISLHPILHVPMANVVSLSISMSGLQFYCVVHFFFCMVVPFHLLERILFWVTLLYV